MKTKMVYLIVLLLVLAACGTSKNVDNKESEISLKEELKKKNRANISLLDQLRQLPGVALRNGVPVFTKTASTISDRVPIEPLYVLDDYIVGQSFRDLDQLVQNVNVEKIETFTGSDASFYGSRAANGVIKITTIKE